MAKTASAWRRPAAASLGGERAGLTHRLAPPGRCGSGGPAVRTSQADVEAVPVHGRDRGPARHGRSTLNTQHSTSSPLRGVRYNSRIMGQDAQLARFLVIHALEKERATGQAIVDFPDDSGGRQLGEAEADGGVDFFEAVTTVFFGEARRQQTGQEATFC